jgi:hypothetical protein
MQTPDLSLGGPYRDRTSDRKDACPRRYVCRIDKTVIIQQVEYQPPEISIRFRPTNFRRSTQNAILD